jgi:GTP-binding protein
VATLVLDAVQGVTTQDASIAGQINEDGRPIVLVFNKWDLVESPETRVRELDDEVDRRLAFIVEAPRLTVSALTGQRVFKVLDEARVVARAACRRVGTPELNRFLATTMAERFAGGSASPKALYMTQTSILPPRFVVFCRQPSRVEPAFRRFLERRIREEFQFGPTPIVLDFRASR